jgi:thimet oligopeptidase
MRHLRTPLCLALSLILPTGAARAQDGPNPPAYPAHFDAQELTRRVDRWLEAARADLRRLLDVRGRRTAANTLRPWDEALNQVHLAERLVRLAIDVHPDSSVRAQGLRDQERVARFQSERQVDPRLAHAFEALDTVPLTPEQRLLTLRVRRDFHRAGADRDEETRRRVREALEALERLSTMFARNIAEDTATFSATPEELAGMPADWIARHGKDAQGRFILTTKYPDFFPIITFAQTRALRLRAVVAFARRGWPANGLVLDSLLRTREAMAQLLGYPNWASYQAEIQMAGSADSIRAFLERVDQASRPARERLIARYLARLRKEDLTVSTLDGGDATYVGELLRREEYALDGREVRAYFPFEQVKAGLLALAQELFGLEFRRLHIPLWHPSVEAYEARSGGRLIGRFYLDLHPRADKYQHAAMKSLRPGLQGRQLGEAILVTNFPGGEGGDPGLMEPAAVQNFFHEFGHLLHFLFAVRPYYSTDWPDEHDFIEAPSQMLEEWVMQPAVLRRFARHYQTGEPIPASLVRRMNEADAFQRPLQAGMQAAFSQISLRLHDHPAAEANPDSLTTWAFATYWGIRIPPDLHFATSFDHLGYNEYSATYYTYLWSQVISKDLWSAFDPDRPLDPAPVHRYRDMILRPGGSKPAADLVREFLGRPFGFESWRRWLEGKSVAGTP